MPLLFSSATGSRLKGYFKVRSAVQSPTPALRQPLRRPCVLCSCASHPWSELKQLLLLVGAAHIRGDVSPFLGRIAQVFLTTSSTQSLPLSLARPRSRPRGFLSRGFTRRERGNECPPLPLALPLPLLPLLPHRHRYRHYLCAWGFAISKASHRASAAHRCQSRLQVPRRPLGAPHHITLNE